MTLCQTHFLLLMVVSMWCQVQRRLVQTPTFSLKVLGRCTVGLAPRFANLLIFQYSKNLKDRHQTRRKRRK